MKQPPNKGMMIMLLPQHVMGALKGPDDQSGEGEPTEAPSGEGEAESEDMGGEEEMMSKGKMMGKKCPMCGRH